jgi:hypothetical protein
MVTTLPEPESPNPVRDPENLWGSGYDFYSELADYIIVRLPSSHTQKAAAILTSKEHSTFGRSLEL